MVQVIGSGRAPKGPSFLQSIVGGAAQKVPEAIQQYQQMQQQNQSMQQENEAYKRMGIDLSGITNPQMRKEYLSHHLRGRENEQQNLFQSQENERKFERESKLKADQLAGKQEKEEEDRIIPFQNALDALDKMKNLRKKGNLGLGSSFLGYFGGERAKDRGEYQTLGNSLIQFASSIPIRNKAEFEQLSGRLSDPSITDDEAEGVLNALESIIKGNLGSLSGQNGQNNNNKKERPPLTEAFE